MKEVIQRKAFWALLIVLLLAVFVYPPFAHKGRYGMVDRDWGWFFSFGSGEVDFKMLLVEAVIAILLSIWICSISFKKIGKFLAWKRCGFGRTCHSILW